MLLGGKTVFPITLGNGPPFEGNDPASGLKGWTEIARAGVRMLRVYPKWNAANAATQIQTVKDQLVAASRYGLRLWVGLYDVANDLSKQALLEQIIDGLKDSPGSAPGRELTNRCGAGWTRRAWWLPTTSFARATRTIRS